MSLSPQRVDFDVYWKRLSSKIEKIIRLEGISGMEMFSDIYKLCTAQPHPFSEKLYHHLKQFLTNHVQMLYLELEKCDGAETLVSEYLQRWIAYSTGCEYNHVLFRYLNTNWIKKKTEESRNKLGNLYHSSTSATNEIYDVITLSLVIWKEVIFEKIKARLIVAINHLINLEREGEQVNLHKIQRIISSFVRLGAVHRLQPLEIYQKDFQAPFFRATTDFYALESGELIEKFGASSYMTKAIARIEEEGLRSKRYLDLSSADLYQDVLNQVLIVRHQTALYSGCEEYFKQDSIENLKKMHSLFKRIQGGIIPILKIMENHIVTVGLSNLENLGADSKDPKKYMQSILGTQKHFMGIVKEAFGNDISFLTSLDASCKKVVNENPLCKKTPSHSAEMLAKYTDTLLRKTTKNLDENELEEQINNALTVFNYVSDKDVFQKFYSKLLARRLIQGTSLSEYSESQMIGGLKKICGFEYTVKLQRMFTDIGIASEMNEKLKEYIAKTHVTWSFDFSVQVLTAVSWPLSPPATAVVLPTDLVNSLTIFQTFYNTQHNGRRLVWMHHISKGEIRATCLKKKYEFQLSAYQMALLLAFNESNQLTLSELSNITNLEGSELTRSVDPLVDAKLLKKTEDNCLVVNQNFINKRLKIKLNTHKETPKENVAIHRAIEQDRTLYLQAAIVRVMKSRRELDHVNLVQEVVEIASRRFQPNISLIKKCIESLIEKEYLTRASGSNNRYIYNS